MHAVKGAQYSQNSMNMFMEFQNVLCICTCVWSQVLLMQSSTLHNGFAKTLNTQAPGQLSHVKIINPYIHSTPINRILSTAQILLVL